jgi:hypothetical protein
MESNTKVNTTHIESGTVTDKVSPILVCKHIVNTTTKKHDRNGPEYVATNQINPDLLALLENGKKYKPTGKVDGTGCIVLNGKILKKRDLKTEVSRANPPPGWIQTGQDNVSGHLIGFMPLDAGDKWHLECYVKKSDGSINTDRIMTLTSNDDCTGLIYKEIDTSSLNGCSIEVVGPNWNKNPHGIKIHCVMRHGEIILDNFPDLTKYINPNIDIKMQTDQTVSLNLLQDIKDWFHTNDQGSFLEGVVLHFDNGLMYKLHRHHLSMKWGNTEENPDTVANKSHYKKGNNKGFKKNYIKESTSLNNKKNDDQMEKILFPLDQIKL